MTYAVGEGPIAVVVADFNNDGFEDVAIANNSLSDNGVSVLFGDGSGTLGPRNTFEMDNNPSNLAVGDFNGDGYPDIALSSRTHDSVTVLLSTNGAFSSTYAYNSQSTLQGLAVADFNGDGITDLAATNSSGGLIVLTGLAPSRTTLTSSLNPSVVGQLVTLTATVTPVPLSGSVQFADFGSGTLGTQPLVDGIAVLTTSTLAAGNHFINASYSGNATLARSSGFVFQVVNTAGASPTTTLLTSSQSSAPFGQAVILTATVSAESATGIVQFIDGASILGSATVTNQVAVLSWSAFSVGFHSLTAIYSGDANNLSSTSSALPQTVTPANGCGITAEPAIFSDSVGGPQTLTITSTQPSCTWEASTSTPWISLSGSGGTGSGTLTVTVAPQTNPALARTGAIQLASQSIVVTQRITATTFSDVPPDATYFDAANMLFTNHITEGCGGSPIEFCPTADIPRWEMAVLIVRAIFGGDNFPSAGTNPYFNDVPLGDPGFAWIQKLAQLGITSGCGNGNYCPAEFVPRDEAAVFTTRMRYGATAVFDFPPVAYFTDVTPQTFGWVSIQRMREDNITSGCAPTLFCPSDLVTRADMAEFIMRAEFNQFLPAGAPAISTISPATITHGNTATYTVTGLNTNFVQGVTDLAPMAGITIGAVTVNSPTSLTVTLTAASDAALQPVSLVAITGAPPGNEEAALPNGLVIQ